MIYPSGSNPINLLFCWSGLPPYAAHCISEFCARNPNVNVQVICTRPKVPYAEFTRNFPAELTVVEPNELDAWRKISGKPDLALQTNYSIPAFRDINQRLRQYGVPILLASDHNWTGSVRQVFIDKIRHKAKYRKMFDGVFVPGKSGEQYHREMGYNPKNIYRGLYGANPSIFSSKTNLSERPKRFLFAGQLTERKNVSRLVRAFEKAFVEDKTWELVVCGSGPLERNLESSANIRVLRFVQPEELARLMRDSRVFILPSIEEHWGVAVHEAALSGVALALSKEVGSRWDLASADNSVIFNPFCIDDIAKKMHEISQWPHENLCSASNASLAFARKFGPHVFAERVEQIMIDFS